ncbi:hypothetical protein MNBD_GAMMA03-517 [hydrothermal vent metagenome]|uniref:FG-GAP repeat protein n=1 Tax=hydrothermal vent metagenome TaxID=652676 RepID=A0A3B0WZG5_9ZZZZ
MVFGLTATNSGTVLIIYGRPNGLASTNSQLLFQSIFVFPPTFESLNGVEDNDFFGKSLASGDFNCDGITDLAVGTPDEDVTIDGELRSNVGAINIFYGSVDGFADLGQGSTFLLQYPAPNSFIEENDRFGWSMAAANFNGDTFNGIACDDLAVSAPFEDFNAINDVGFVSIFSGSDQGLSENDVEIINQVTDGLTETIVESHDQFGYSLAAGHLTSNGGMGVFDLVVGIPGENIDGEINAGAVQVFKGSFGGLDNAIPSDVWSQSGDIIGVVEANDRFGSSVAVGNFNGDFLDDVAIGVPRENLNSAGINDAGSINIIYSGQFGLETDGNQIFHQDTDGIDGDAEDDDRFGDALTTGDLNGDSIDDLVIGVPRENNSKGAFHILFGSSDGITTVDSIFEKNLGGGEELDEMGYAMTIANFGNGKQLAVGIPGDDSEVGGFNDAGSVEVFSFNNDVIFKNSFED